MGSRKRRASSTRVWLAAVISSVLISVLAAPYASAATSRSASIPDTPSEFTNGNFENPRWVGGMPFRWSATPEGWTLTGQDKTAVPPMWFVSDSPFEQNVILGKNAFLSRSFRVEQRASLRFSFDVKSTAAEGTLSYGFNNMGIPSSSVAANANWKNVTGEFYNGDWQAETAIFKSSVDGIALRNVKIEYVPVVAVRAQQSAVPLEVDKSAEVAVDVADEGGAPGSGAAFGAVFPRGITYAPGSAKVNGNAAPGAKLDDSGRLTIPIGSGAESGQGGELKRGDKYTVTYRVEVDPRHLNELSKAKSFAQKIELKLDGRWRENLGVTSFNIVHADVGFGKGGFTKTDGYMPGDKADVVFFVKNSGPETAQNVKLSVKKPVGIKDFKASDGDGCVENDGDTECIVGTLEKNASKSITFSGTVENVGSLEAVGKISSSAYNPTGSDGSITYTSKSSNDIDLGVHAKILDGDTGDQLPEGSVVKPGQKLRLVVDASNAGPSPTGRFKVHVQLPQGVVPSEPADGYDQATGEWNIGQMQAGGRASLTLPVTVPADETRLAFRADIDPDSYKDLKETDSKNNMSQTSVDVARKAELKVAVSAAPSAGGASQEYTPGESVTYTIDVTNDGPSTAPGVKVAHVMPTGMKPEDPTGPNETSYRDGVWTISSISAGETVELTVKGIVPADQEKTVHRVCVVGTASGFPGEYKPCDESNDMAGHVAVSELHVVQRAAALVTVVPEGGTGARPLPGQKVSWTVKSANPGVSQAKGLEIEVPVPAGVTGAESVLEGGGSYEDGLWKPADVPVGGAAVLKLTGTVLPDHDQLEYRATVKKSTTALDESKSIKTAESTVAVQQVAGLDVAIAPVDGKDSVKVGEQARVKVTVSNKEGPSTARGTVAELGIQPVEGLTHDGGSDFNGEPGGDGFGTWKIGDLKPGQEKSLTLTFTPKEAKDFTFDVLSVRSDAANPQECQDVCASTQVKVTADAPNDNPDKPNDPDRPNDPDKPNGPDTPGDQTPPPGDGQEPPADSGGSKGGDDGGKSLVDQVLASTGSSAVWWGAGALGAAGIGAALLIAARRR
ncbi:hypothetical protein ACTVZO_32125 [Streptomyces sp. IBSNAI002]|uniref:hypothetical protein n=1 Tax=Streptomyces sp. IBSNAI002 TaxID=3457500 RepID=UPI003FD1F936